MFDRIEFMISEAFSALRRNGWMTFAAISTVAVALFLLGGLGYLYLRLNEFAESLPGKLDMRVHLKDGVPKEKISLVAANIRKLPGVKSAVWLPKDIEWKKWKANFPGALTEGTSPFPDAFKVVLTNLDRSDPVIAAIKKMPEVDPTGVRYDSQVRDAVAGWLNFIRWLGGSLGGLLFVTAGILIYNAIRLTIDSRRREIGIMRLVGASNRTVQTPFLIEGVVQGLLGGTVATVLLISANAALKNALTGMTVVSALPPFPLSKSLFILGGAGVVYGFACAAMALRAPMKQQ